MNMTMIRLLTLGILAVSIARGAQFIPEIKDIATPELAGELAAAHRNIAAKNYAEAIRRIDNALALSTAPEFANPDPQSGPLALQLAAMKLFCQGSASGFGSTFVARDANQLLADHQRAAQGNNWYAFSLLYTILIENLKADNAFDSADAMYGVALAYSPRNGDHIAAYIDWAIGKGVTNSLRQRVRDFRKAGGTIPAGQEFTYVAYLRSVGDPETYAQARALLTAHPSGKVPETLAIMRAAIDAGDFVQVRNYYDFLSRLALNQPSDEAGIPALSTILNERQKLLLIFPAL